MDERITIFSKFIAYFNKNIKTLIVKYFGESTMFLSDSFPENANSCKFLHMLELDSIGFSQLADGEYVLTLCFYDFNIGCFVGNQLKFFCLSNASCIILKQNIIVCSRADTNSLIVVELANCDDFVLGWTVISLTDISEQIGPISLDFVPRLSPVLERFPFFSGSCQMLLLISSIKEIQTLYRKDAVLSAHKLISTTPSDLPLPLFYFMPQSFFTANSELSKTSVIVDNILIRYSNWNQLECDSFMLDLLSREFYYSMNEKWVHGTSDANLQILERRLRISAHNGLTFLDEPVCLLLEPLPHLNSFSNTPPFVTSSGWASTSDHSDFVVRQSVRLRNLPFQSELSVVFELFYLVACPNTKGLITNARLIRVAWTAWYPFEDDKLHLKQADTISLQMIGGSRFSPIKIGCCFQDLSASDVVSQSTPFTANRIRIDIHFNFALLNSLIEDDVSEHRVTEESQSAQSVRSYNIPKYNDEEKFQRSLILSPESALDDSTIVDFELLEENSALPCQTKVPSRKQYGNQIKNPESYRAIFFELPLCRIRPLPRALILELARFPPISLNGPLPRSVDIMTQNEFCPDMELELGEKLWLSSEFCLQFLAFTPSSVGFPFLQTPLKLFFTFQFYRFHSFVTESLSTNCDDDNILLWCKNDQQNRKQPGLTLRFVVDDTQHQDFCTYLLESTLILHVWEADSIFYLGVASIPLKHLLRQGSPSVQCSVECEVLQSGFPHDLSPLHGSLLNGLLFLRLANIGLSKLTANNKTNSSTIIKRVRHLHKSHATALEHFMTLHKIDFAQRASQLFDPEEHKRVSNWNRMKGSENFGGISNYFKHERKTQKFLFAEELAAYRAIRTEGKAHTLLKAVFSSITTRMHVDLTLGQLYLFSFQLRNPLAEEFICEIESNDRNLGPICSSDELKFLQGQFNDIDRFSVFGANSFQSDSNRLCRRLALRSMEQLNIPMRFDSGLNDVFDNRNNQQFIQGDCRVFVRKLPSGNPLAIFELNYTIWRPFLKHHLRWFTDECRKFARAIRLPKSFGFTRCSDPTIYCQLSEEGNVLLIECQVGEAPTIRDFLLFFYNENFAPIELLAVWRISIHSFRRLHSETVQGQQVRISLNFCDNDLLSTPGDELIRLFCSSPLQSHFLPGSVFSASNMSIQPAIVLSFQQLGRHYLLVNAIRTSAQQILCQWLLTLTVGKPNITKTFQMIVPSQVQKVVHKV
ncbi:hypothetical protein Mgra_00005902 [Meloidogyne graminicola]|uniref:NPHP4 C2-like domain-containing protein n=1 Tax=Meloidogyne graminicola TaxID=189291 RepID=A0A8S9ZN66_9BILA|nr:hypothetical protein Mgra_00005902 [Meloidogyne graminicola]